MTAQTRQPFRVQEKTTASYACVITDHAGTPIPAVSMTTLKLTLYDLATDAIINARNAVSVLNVNGGTLDSSGNFTMIFDIADNVILGSATATRDLADLVAARGSQPLPLKAKVRSQVETHVAFFEFTYAAGTRAGKHEVFVDVLNLNKVS